MSAVPKEHERNLQPPFTTGSDNAHPRQHSYTPSEMQFLDNYRDHSEGHFEGGVYIIDGQTKKKEGYKDKADHTTAAPYVSTKSAHKGSVSATATETLVVNDLHWWSSHLDILVAINMIGITLKPENLTSTEHKVNGKTKGSIYISCKSPEEAQRIADYFRHNDFQGRRLTTAFVSKSALTLLKTPAATNNNPRPVLGTASLAQHPPTNAHGGINFNRLRQHNRAFVQQNPIGVGHPSVPRSVQPKVHQAEPHPVPAWTPVNPWMHLDQYHMPHYMPATGGMLPVMPPPMDYTPYHMGSGHGELHY